MDSAIIMDLDSTLCDCQHRLKYITEYHPKQWDMFYGELRKDSINEWCATLIKKFKDFEIIFITGRPEKYFTATYAWLQQHDIPATNIKMRKDGDHRPSAIVKEEIYLKYIKEKYNVLFCVDDEKSVAEMWRKQGLVCLQCR